VKRRRGNRAGGAAGEEAAERHRTGSSRNVRDSYRVSQELLRTCETDAALPQKGGRREFGMMMRPASMETSEYGPARRVGGRNENTRRRWSSSASSSFRLRPPRETSFLGSSSDFVAGGGRSWVGRGGHPVHHSGTVPGGGEAEGRQRGGVWQGAIRVFRGRHPCRRSAPGASRYRSPPRDLVDSRTARTVEAAVPARRTHRRSLRLNGEAGSWKRRAAGGGVGGVQRVHGGKGVCGRFRDTHRCGSLRRHGGRLCRATDPRALPAADLR
jgi:hypothetical protein